MIKRSQQFAASQHNWRRILLPAVSFLVAIVVFTTQFRYGIPRDWNAPRIASTLVPLELLEEVNDLEIREVIELPDDEFLLAATTADPRETSGFTITGGCSIGIGSETLPARIVGAGGIGEGRRGIRCRIERPFRQKVNAPSRARAQLRSASGKIIRSSSEIPLLQWNRLVYEVLVTDQDVVLFTKGIFPARKEELERELMSSSRCVFFNDDSSQVVAETKLVSLSQEVARCRHPPEEIREQLLGNKLSVRRSDIAPSAVVYHRPTIVESLNLEDIIPTIESSADADRRHSLCACTMVYNSAKFLREWVRYHSHLGVSKFFLYDNNSEDSLEQTVAQLNKESPDVRITVRAWPWIKTQEAGFSHCALRARDECEWMAFVDVDEFIFPKAYLQSSGSNSYPPADAEEEKILPRLIKHTLEDFIPSSSSNATSIGQISMPCRDFGPSGLTRHPTEGVTRGYTCRVAREQRHKSLVKLEALDRSLANVIHRFVLSPSFSTARMLTSRSVINHYKYQAWAEFKNKFRRRVSAYVSDWRESKNLNSQDRAPGLGNRAIKPDDWETRFCEVEDKELRNYVVNTGLELVK